MSLVSCATPSTGIPRAYSCGERLGQSSDAFRCVPYEEQEPLVNISRQNRYDEDGRHVLIVVHNALPVMCGADGLIAGFYVCRDRDDRHRQNSSMLEGKEMTRTLIAFPSVVNPAVGG